MAKTVQKTAAFPLAPTIMKPTVPETFLAFTTLRVPGGYSFIELTVDKDMKVVDVKTTQPDIKAITTEKFKIAVGKYWQRQEDGK